MRIGKLGIWSWGLGLWMAQVGLSPAVAQTSSNSALCPAQLSGAIASITNRPELQRTRWGILVQPQGSEQPLYAEAAQEYFIPASNVKLLTSAAALTQLGANFRIRTSVYQTGTTLRVVGRGDPSFGDSQLQQLAQQIRSRGVTQVDRLLANSSYFHGDPVNPGWEWEDVQAGYGAPVTSLMLNGNAIDLRLIPQAIGQPLRIEWGEPTEAQYWQVDNRSITVAATEPEFVQISRDLSRPLLQIQGQLSVGSAPDISSIAIPDPIRSFLRRFRLTLVSQQIPVTQIGIVTDSPADQIEIAAIESPPLSALLIPTNQESKNLYAESLLRQLAAPQGEITLEAAIVALETTLTGLGVDPAGYALADGSGLSRHNLVSPEALVQTLQAMAQSPVYRSSLAVAGESGTLGNRFRGTIAQGNLQGKTGALSGVAALSGYLDPPRYPPLVFSILVNHFDQPVREVRPAIDAIVLELTRLQSCNAAP